jgi:hypothetical protein
VLAQTVTDNAVTGFTLDLLSSRRRHQPSAPMRFNFSAQRL